MFKPRAENGMRLVEIPGRIIDCVRRHANCSAVDFNRCAGRRARNRQSLGVRSRRDCRNRGPTTSMHIDRTAWVPASLASRGIRNTPPISQELGRDVNYGNYVELLIGCGNNLRRSVSPMQRTHAHKAPARCPFASFKASRRYGSAASSLKRAEVYVNRAARLLHILRQPAEKSFVPELAVLRFQHPVALVGEE
jgi:hypothetical protein